MLTDQGFWSDQARTITEGVEDWKTRHDEAMGVLELEPVVHIAASSGTHFVRFVSQVFAALFDGKMRKIQECGHLLLKTCGMMEEALEIVRVAVAQAEQAGYEVDGASEIPGVIASVAQAARKVKQQWPLLTEEHLRLGFEQADRGELVDVEDVLRELENSPHQ